MRCAPPTLTLDDLSRRSSPEPNELKSPAPSVVVECWRGFVERALDRFTRAIWGRFDHRDLERLKWAILSRRPIFAAALAAADGVVSLPGTASRRSSHASMSGRSTPAKNTRYSVAALLVYLALAGPERFRCRDAVVSSGA